MTHCTHSGGLLAALFVASLCPSALAGSGLPSVSGPAPEARAREPYRLEARLSPDGRWVAVLGSRGWSDELRCWIVPVESGVQREILDVHPSGPQTIGWDEHGHVRVQVVNTEHGVPEMRWIDVTTGEVSRWTRDRQLMRDEARTTREPWGEVSERKAIDGRTLRSVSWSATGQRAELESRGESRCELSPQPGIGFFTSTVGGVQYLKRFDCANNLQDELVETNAIRFDWSLSVDGRKLLVTERTLENRVRVLDSTNGALVDGPWLADEPRWVEGADGRYFVAVQGTRRMLFDLARDRELEIGPDEGEWLEIRALSNGKFVVEDDREVALYDSNWRRERALFTAPVDTRLASR
ncbi:MAG: hypothetical protein HUU28_02405 [Planctomycetaceae bacterium]|nr:hypothetical protein [Planctomycetaceae bacterium]